MVYSKNETFILKIIKYIPIMFIIITSIVTTFYICFNYTNTLNIEKKRIKKEYIDFNNEKLQNKINILSEYINSKSNLSNQFLKEEIKQQVYTAHHMMQSIYDEFKDTRTKKEIILIIKAALKSIKFNNGRGYYFIYDLDGINIFHPIKPEREGKSLFDFKDINGDFIIQESINIAKSMKSEGYQTWMFSKPNKLLKEYKKIGFIKKFEPFNWFIGVGEYVEEFNSEIKKEILEHIINFRYKENENIFVIDKRGDLLLRKTNLYEMNKKNLFIEQFNDFVNSEKEGTYLKYELIDHDRKYVNKISFLKKIKVYDWVIGNEFNLDNLKLKIEEKQKELIEDYNDRIYITLIFAIFITTLFLIIAIFISRLLKNNFLEYKENLEKQILRNKKQKETLLRAQEVAKIGDWKLNIKTNKSYWSKGIIRILGVKEEDKNHFGPEFLKTIMINEDKALFINSLNECISIGKEFICIYRIRISNNEIRWIESRGIRDKDKLSIIGTMQDITYIKNLEIEKQQKDEILYQQSKMAAMGEMIGNIAHQWRQPLSVISIASTGAKLQKEMKILSDSDLIPLLTSINASAQYLSTTIDDFRGFFNPNNNKISTFNISNTFTKTLNLINAQFISNNIEFVLNIEEFELSSMENELIQVLINVLNNGRDALMEKENQKRLIFLNTYIKENIAYIEIQDNAGGIEKEIINRIFEPYFTTKHKAQGTGIGLFMSKEIIEKHLDGKILVSNVAYKFDDINYNGAKFTIELPVLKLDDN